MRAIAALIGRSASTVSREIARNGGRDAYRAAAAEAAAWDRGRRPKPSRLASNPALLADVRGRLEEDWSPEQLGLDVYFCDPPFSMRDLDDIARRVNTRPRPVLGWATAHDRFWPHVRAASVS